VAGVVGETLLADAVPVDQDLIGLAGRAGTAVSGRGRPAGADLACTVDFSKSLEAGTGLCGGIVGFVGSTDASADAPLVGEESREAVAVLGGGVVGGVDGAGDAVPVGDEVVHWAGLADAVVEAESWITETGLGGG
jgi:hypothetical protein